MELIERCQILWRNCARVDIRFVEQFKDSRFQIVQVLIVRVDRFVSSRILHGWSSKVLWSAAALLDHLQTGSHQCC